MRDHIRERVIVTGTYVVNASATVRQAARAFGVSKSTTWKDVVERLPEVNPELADRAIRVIQTNKQERHLRGGLATRLKYQQRRDNGGES